MGGDELGLGMWMFLMGCEGLERGVGRGGYWGGIVGGDGSLHRRVIFLHGFWGGIRGSRTVLRSSLLKTWNQFLRCHSHVSYAIIF